MTAGVLSPVLARLPSGSPSTELRSTFSEKAKPRRTPSFTMSSTLMSLAHDTSMPTSRKTMTMPVSWQIGRLPSAHMRELTSTCAKAAFAAGDSSRS